MTDWRRRATRRLRSWQTESLAFFKYAPGDSLAFATFTGPAGRTYLDANGVWQTVGANVARDAHYIGGVRHLLLEGQRQNAATGSCSLADGTYWANNTSWTLSPATSCIAGQTAYRHVNNNTGAGKSRTQAIGTFVKGQTDCLAVIVENDAELPATTTVLDIYDNTATAVAHRATFTWATHAIAGGAGTGTQGVQDLGNGRYLIWVTTTGTASGTGGNGNVRRAIIYATGTAQNGQAVILHYAALETAAAYPSSPIVTVASPVTRTADSLALPQTWPSQTTTRYWRYYDLATRVYVDLADVGTRAGPDDFTNAAQLNRAYTNLAYYRGAYCPDTVSIPAAGIDVSAFASAQVAVDIGWGRGTLEGSSDSGSTWAAATLTHVTSDVTSTEALVEGFYLVDVSALTNLRYTVGATQVAPNAASATLLTAGRLAGSNAAYNPTVQYTPTSLAELTPAYHSQAVGDLVWVDNASAQCYYKSGCNIYKSTDYGDHLTVFTTPWSGDAANIVDFFRVLDDGSMLAVVDIDAASEIRVYTGNAAGDEWTQRNAYDSAQQGSSISWGIQAVGDVIVYAHYTAATAPRSFPVDVWLSRDRGLTWASIYQLPLTHRHIHDVVFDSYRQRIWVTAGDNRADAVVLYTDDFGTTWNTFWDFNEGPAQFTTVQPMPDCVLFGADLALATALYRHIPGAPTTYSHAPVDAVNVLAYALCPARRGHQFWESDAVYTAHFDFSRVGKLIGSKDGKNFYTLWTLVETPNESGSVPGLHNVFGPDANGNLVGNYYDTVLGRKTWVAAAPTWEEIA